jgi:ABC-type uncharacterized transport system permease subunit
MEFSDILRIAFEEACRYAPLMLAVSFAFRIAHFPDVGLLGSYSIGAACVVFCQSVGLGPIISLSFAIILGASTGFLTGWLYINRRLNALIAGIITSLICYAITFFLLDKRAQGNVNIFTSEIQSGIVGLLFVVIICIFFSTRYGIRFRFAGESPLLLQSVGIEYKREYLSLIVVSNIIASIAGYFVAGSTGSITLRINDEMLFMSVGALVLGEAMVSIILLTIYLLKQLLKMISFNNTLSNPAVKRHNIFNVMLSGAGAFYPLAAALLGSFIYWFMSGVLKEYFGATEWTRLVVGIMMAAWLSLINMLPKTNIVSVGQWKFHGDLS